MKNIWLNILGVRCVSRDRDRRCLLYERVLRRLCCNGAAGCACARDRRHLHGPAWQRHREHHVADPIFLCYFSSISVFFSMVSGSNRLPVTAPPMCGFPHEKISSRNRREEIFLSVPRVRKEIYNRAVPVIHYAQNCILRSLRRFGRQGKCGCKAPRVGHCEAAGRRISQNTRRLQAFLPEPEVAWLNEEISFGRFCCTCPPVPAGRIFLFQEEST